MIAHGIIPIRFWIIFLIFFASYMTYIIPANLYLSIEFMVQELPESKPAYCTNKPNLTHYSSKMENIRTLPNYGPRYDWTESQQSWIQHTFLYGFVISSVPSGITAEYLGPFNIVLWAIAVGGIFNSLCAAFARVHWRAVVVCRFIMGVSMGFVYPALICWIARWAPPYERGIFVSALTGSELGTCLTRIIVRLLTPIIGWQWVFHLLTIKVLLFCPVLWLLGANDPKSHPAIKPSELEYIKTSQKRSVSNVRAVPPYKLILTSSAFWAVNILHFGNAWGQNFQFFAAPKYMEEFIGFSMDETVLLDALPHLGLMVSAFLFGSVADFLRAKNLFRNTFMVKFFTFFSHFIPGFCLIFMGTVNCNARLAITLLFTAMGFNGAGVVTDLRNSIDISPNFAGTIFGLIQVTGEWTVFIVPALTNAILQYRKGIVEWSIVFLIGGGCFLGTALIFWFFGSGTVQAWNKKKIDVEGGRESRPRIPPPAKRTDNNDNEQGGKSIIGLPVKGNENKQSNTLKVAPSVKKVEFVETKLERMPPPVKSAEDGQNERENTPTVASPVKNTENVEYDGENRLRGLPLVKRPENDAKKLGNRNRMPPLSKKMDNVENDSGNSAREVPSGEKAANDERRLEQRQRRVKAEPDEIRSIVAPSDKTSENVEKELEKRHRIAPPVRTNKNDQNDEDNKPVVPLVKKTVNDEKKLEIRHRIAPPIKLTEKIQNERENRLIAPSLKTTKNDQNNQNDEKKLESRHRMPPPVKITDNVKNELENSPGLESSVKTAVNVEKNLEIRHRIAPPVKKIENNQN